MTSIEMGAPVMMDANDKRHVARPRSVVFGEDLNIDSFLMFVLLASLSYRGGAEPKS